MIVGLGTDCIGISRIDRARERHGQRFLDRVYTSEEQQYCLKYRSPGERLAARWAAKEAALKALGTGLIGNMSLTHIEIKHNPLGAPLLHLHAAVAQRALELGVIHSHVSLSHADGVAVATVIFEGKSETNL